MTLPPGPPGEGLGTHGLSRAPRAGRPDGKLQERGRRPPGQGGDSPTGWGQRTGAGPGGRAGPQAGAGSVRGMKGWRARRPTRQGIGWPRGARRSVSGRSEVPALGGDPCKCHQLETKNFRSSADITGGEIAQGRSGGQSGGRPGVASTGLSPETLKDPPAQ